MCAVPVLNSAFIAWNAVRHRALPRRANVPIPRVLPSPRSKMAARAVGSLVAGLGPTERATAAHRHRAAEIEVPGYELAHNSWQTMASSLRSVI
jgi:hypothetical protein